ncbi:MAG: hypothetical protein F7C32_00825 [Desulfurococcales archaeon]|nr:hypothetical protein [Desulfurococcales archaeon]
MYAGKEQGIIDTISSFWLAVLWRIIVIVENDSLATGRNLREYQIYFDGIYDLFDGYVQRTRRPDVLTVYVSPYPSEYDVSELDLFDVSLEIEPLEGDGLGYKYLLRNIYRIPFIYDKNILRKFALKTENSDIEYMFIFLDDGRLAYLEGYEGRVSIPHVTSVATLHTHPRNSCMLSSPDVESAADVLVDGGFFSGAITSSCGILLARTGFIDEDDFIELKKLAHSIRKYRDVRSIMTVLTDFQRKAKNVSLVKINY